MRRPGPRRLAEALERIAPAAAPPTPLARIQAVWSDAVGPAIAAEARPVAERDGTVTIACRSAAWASELELLAPDLLDKLGDALGDAAGGGPTALRTRVAAEP